MNDLQQWRAAIERHESYDELILWFEHDLFDQLNLIQLLTLIRERLPATKPVTLVCIGSFPGRPHFKGLGELTPDELASLLETRQRVSDAQFALAARAWQAFREPTPEASGQPSARRHVGVAVSRRGASHVFSRNTRGHGDGLSRTERRLLELAKGDGIALRKAFPRMHEGEHAYYITDLSLAAMAESLSSASPALLTLGLGPAAEGQVLQGHVALTDTGRSVLAGQLDRVATCGIDRWFGGVHLQSGSRVWRWDETRQRVV